MVNVQGGKGNFDPYRMDIDNWPLSVGRRILDSVKDAFLTIGYGEIWSPVFYPSDFIAWCSSNQLTISQRNATYLKAQKAYLYLKDEKNLKALIPAI